MRLGIILGFLIGGGIATLMRLKEQQADGEARPLRDNPVVERIRHQLDEAKQAAHEAQLEKEAEMRRMFDEMVRRKDDAGTQ